MEDHARAQDLLRQLTTAPDGAQTKLIHHYTSEMSPTAFHKLLEYRRNHRDHKRMDNYLASSECPFKTFDCSKIKVVHISNISNTTPVQTIMPHPECNCPPMETFTRTYDIGAESYPLVIHVSRLIVMKTVSTDPEEVWDLMLWAKYRNREGHIYSFREETIFDNILGLKEYQESSISKGMYGLLQKVATDLGLLHLEESEVIKGLMGLFWGTEVLNGKWYSIESYGRVDNLSDVVLHPERYYRRRIRAHRWRK